MIFATSSRFQKNKPRHCKRRCSVLFFYYIICLNNLYRQITRYLRFSGDLSEHGSKLYHHIETCLRKRLKKRLEVSILLSPSFDYLKFHEDVNLFAFQNIIDMKETDMIQFYEQAFCIHPQSCRILDNACQDLNKKWVKNELDNGRTDVHMIGDVR